MLEFMVHHFCLFYAAYTYIKVLAVSITFFISCYVFIDAGHSHLKLILKELDEMVSQNKMSNYYKIQSKLIDFIKLHNKLIE